MKELELTADDAIEYLRNEVKIYDTLEIAYNKAFAFGEVLNLDFSEYFGVPGFKILISMDDESLNPTVEIDLIEYKEDIIEFHHFPKDGEDVYVTIL